jgi:hypothetical protein
MSERISSYPRVSETLEMIEHKKQQYGDSLGNVSTALKIFYPDGCPPDKMGEFILVARLLEKISRLTSPGVIDKTDIYQDLAGYCLLALGKDQK